MLTWVNTAFVCVCDLGLAALAAYFADPDERVVVFLVVIGTLWLLPIALELWALIKFWIGYHVFLKERLTRFYLAEFNRHSLPSARAYFDHMLYASTVFDDEELGLDKKLRLSYLLGEMGGYKSIRYFTMGMATEFAFQEAMERYKAQY